MKCWGPGQALEAWQQVSPQQCGKCYNSFRNRALQPPHTTKHGTVLEGFLEEATPSWPWKDKHRCLGEGMGKGAPG